MTGSENVTSLAYTLQFKREPTMVWHFASIRKLAKVIMTAVLRKNV